MLTRAAPHSQSRPPHDAPLEITLISWVVLGFRHGFDCDHIAAISDITSVQQKTSIAMRLGLHSDTPT